MPVGILESLSYGIPCLITRGTNLGEKIRDNDCGWMAENDPDSVAEAIKRAVGGRSLYETKSVNARKYVQDNFSWDVIMPKTIESYQKLLEEYKDQK